MDSSLKSLVAARSVQDRMAEATLARQAREVALVRRDKPAVLAPHAASVRAILTLALGAYGLIDVVEDLGAPWASLVQTLVLALLAMGFFVAAQRSRDHRVGWLLSVCVAAGLGIAAFYDDVVDAAATPALPAAGLLVCAVVMLFVMRGGQQGSRR